jgi:hypothetical protein
MFVAQQWLSPDEITGVKNGIRGAMRSLRRISGNPIRSHIETSFFSCEVNADCDPRAHDSVKRECSSLLRRRRVQPFVAVNDSCASILIVMIRS